MGVEPATYAVQSEHAAMEAADLVVIFALLTYMGKEKSAKKTNTDPNPKPGLKAKETE